MAKSALSKLSCTTPSSSSSVTRKVSPQPEDVEGQVPAAKATHWQLLFDQAGVTDDVRNFPYAGEGTPENPYVVEYLPQDGRNPIQWSRARKWAITILLAIATLAVSFVSSGYTGGMNQIIEEFDVSEEIAVLGLSVFVLGFAVGPRKLYH